MTSRMQSSPIQPRDDDALGDCTDFVEELRQ